eukprot:TRINITY_DN714_c0_g2_i1.p1 TRINITY_DN714_c0_g2~~TRINITY_DN714_c0_g2_i1.p1  ORF type:complete len:250 (+),score=25.58 TRINITY_DN714_c0_g2_i1:100-849(+)
MLLSFINLKFPQRAQSASKRTRQLLHCFVRDKKGQLMYAQSSEDRAVRGCPYRRCRTARGIYSHHSASRESEQSLDKSSIKVVGAACMHKSRNAHSRYREDRNHYDTESFANSLCSKTGSSTETHFNPRQSLINSKRIAPSPILKNYTDMICHGKSVEKSNRPNTRLAHTSKRIKHNYMEKDRGKGVVCEMKGRRVLIRKMVWGKPVFSVFIKRSHRRREMLCAFCDFYFTLPSFIVYIYCFITLFMRV